MLDSRTKQTIDNACDTLVGKVPSPQTQVDIITTALIYKFMDDMDLDGLELSGKRTFFVGDLEPYAFSTIVNTKGNQERMNLYLTGLEKVQTAKSVPELFRRIFKEAMIPFRDPTTFALFLKEINELAYDDSETIGDAFEYLLNKMATAKNAGQFRTPRNIIDFIVDVVKPTKDDTILDPACGTAGFLISAYKHITSSGKLTPDELKRVTNSIVGMDIDPTMVKLSLVNLYLHRFEQPNIYEYDTLSNDTRWAERYDVILANPPFMTPKGGIAPHKRFAINAKRSEVLFADYFMEHLTINGRAGFVVPEGIIFQTANAYKELRKMMLDGYLYAVVSLPSGVFNPYAGVKTSILFFDRAFAKQNDNILFVRVDNDGFSLGAQRTPIKQNDLPEALKIINEYRDGKDVSGYERAMVVSKERIAENNYDLTAAKYVEKEVIECKYDKLTLGELEAEHKIEFLRGQGLTKKSISDDGINDCILYGDLYTIYESPVIDTVLHKTNDTVKITSVSGDVLVPATTTADAMGIAIARALNKDGILLGGDINIIRTRNQHINSKYLSWVINTVLKSDLARYAKGANILHLSNNDLRKLKIPLPPLDVQQQIVDEIENKQSAISHARKIIENLERERQYFACLLDGINYNEVKLGDVCDTTSGGTPLKSHQEYYQNGTIPWVRSGEVSQGFITSTEIKITERGLKNSSAKLLPVNSVLVAMYGATAGQVGLLKIVACSNQAICSILPNDKIIPAFLYNYLRSQTKYLLSLGAGGAQPNISQQIIKNIVIPLPSIDDQKCIVAKLEAEQEIIDANKRLIDLMQDKINHVMTRIYKCDT